MVPPIQYLYLFFFQGKGNPSGGVIRIGIHLIVFIVLNMSDSWFLSVVLEVSLNSCTIERKARVNEMARSCALTWSVIKIEKIDVEMKKVNL